MNAEQEAGAEKRGKAGWRGRVGQSQARPGRLRGCGGEGGVGMMGQEWDREQVGEKQKVEG